MGTRTQKGRAYAGLIAIVLLGGLYWLLSHGEMVPVPLEVPALREKILGLGIWGPVAVMALMTVAVVLSPLPSAPIALAAGAVYGHTWGTIYVVVGAELGAVIAFITARLVGYEAVRRWIGGRLSLGKMGSQNVLMGAVFVSRLLPFVSFDAVSYAAGLTALTTWRFALATLAGLVPASFLLAHFGGEMGSVEEYEQAAVLILILGVFSLASAATKWVVDRREKASAET